MGTADAADNAAGRPVNFDSEIYKTRNTVERSFNLFKQRRALATRYDSPSPAAAEAFYAPSLSG